MNLRHGIGRTLRNLPQLRDKRLIGRGSFCAVFEGSRHDTVYKLTTDRSAWCYMTGAYRPTGTHTPVVLRDFGDVSPDEEKPVFLVEVERLVPLRSKPPCDYSKGFAFVVKNHWEIFNRGQTTLLFRCPPSLRDFFEDLHIFTSNFECSFDATMRNVMRRHDGTLVASDPVFRPH